MVTVVGLVVLPLPGPAVAQGTPLVTETFTGATADPRFQAFGSACLTGAPAGSPPPAGEHPLSGCSATSVGPVPPQGGAPFGYLQLTDAANDQAGAVLFNEAIPATQGLEVTFDQWQYGSTTPDTPADGISFFLVDGSSQLTAPGAFGGSLGYAQKLPDDDPANSFLPGVNNGYLGIGLDVLGNYFGDWEQRGNGCEQRSPAGTEFRAPAPGPNMVTVRGPGNGTEGYCFLTATTNNFTTTGPWPSTLPGQLQGPTTSLPADATPQEAEALLEPSRRRVTITISPAPDPQVTVLIDFNDGNGPQQVLQFPAPEPVPATYKFGFAGSTGLFTDVHLIRNVQISSLVPESELSLTKSADPSSVSRAGQQVTFEYVVTNTGDLTVDNLALNETFSGTGTPPAITCPSTTVQPGDRVVCTGTYTVSQADLDAGADITNTATATGTDPQDNPVTSPPATATVDVRVAPSLALVKSADPTTVTAAGQMITYSFRATNTGNQTLTGLRINETAFSGTGELAAIICPATTLAPGAETTCTATYQVTEADIEAGSIRNTVTATGTGPDGDAVTSPPSTATVTREGTSRLGAVKTGRAIDVNRDGRITAGDRIEWSLTVTNLGNTTIRQITVADTAAGPVTCPRTELAPDESTTCAVPPHTITRADITAGRVTNVATSSGVSDTGPVSSDPARATVNLKSGDLPVTGASLHGPLAVGAVLTTLGSLLLLATVRRVRRRT